MACYTIISRKKSKIVATADTLEDAVTIAECLSKIYDEYLPIAFYEDATDKSVVVDNIDA